MIVLPGVKPLTHRLNYDNQLLKGVRPLVVAANGIFKNLVGNNLVLSGSPTIKGSPTGLGIYNSGIAGDVGASIDNVGGGRFVDFWHGYYYTGSTATNQYIMGDYNGSLGMGLAGKHSAISGNWGWFNGSSVDNSGEALVAGTLYTFVIVKEVTSGGVKVYRDGALKITSGSSVANTASWAFGSIGQNQYATFGTETVTLLAGRIDCRAGIHWTPAMVARFCADPWQLFEPRRIYVRVPAAGGAFNAAFAESVGLTDSFSAGPAFSSTVAESIGAGDAVSAQATLAAAVSESVAVADQVSAQATFAAALSESVTTADAITAAATYAASLLESLSLADQFEASRAFLAAIEETVALGDQIVGSFAQSAEIVESLSVSDAVAAQTVLAAAFQETLTAADQVSALAQFGAAIVDVVQTGDQATAVVTALTSIAEAVAAVDQFSATVTLAGSGPTAEQIAVAVWDSTLEGTLRARDLMKLHAAALFGKVIRSGNTIVFRNPQDTVNRITAVTDANGNRQSVTTDLN